MYDKLNLTLEDAQVDGSLLKKYNFADMYCSSSSEEICSLVEMHLTRAMARPYTLLNESASICRSKSPSCQVSPI